MPAQKPQEIAEAAAKTGATKSDRSWDRVLVSAFLAGNLVGAVFVAFFLAVQTGVIGDAGSDPGSSAALT